MVSPMQSDDEPMVEGPEDAGLMDVAGAVWLARQVRLEAFLEAARSFTGYTNANVPETMPIRLHGPERFFFGATDVRLVEPRPLRPTSESESVDHLLLPKTINEGVAYITMSALSSSQPHPTPRNPDLLNRTLPRPGQYITRQVLTIPESGGTERMPPPPSEGQRRTHSRARHFDLSQLLLDAEHSTSAYGPVEV